MRRAACLLLVAAAAAADDDLREARKLLASPNTHDRLAAIKMLVDLDSGGAVEALEDAIRRSSRELVQLTPLLDKADSEWLAAWRKRESLARGGMRGTKDHREASRREAELRQERARIALLAEAHLEIVVRAGEAFRKLRSGAAIARIESGARNERHPTTRLFYIAGLGHPSRELSVPVLLEVLQHQDPRFRAAALRALVHFADEPGVLDAAKALADDEAWAVRLGAYQVVACGPFAEAVAFLARAAAREKGEMGLAVDSYLEALTGKSFAQAPGQWEPWFRANAEAVRTGTYVPAPEPERAEGERETVASFFRIPIDSTNLVFVIDFSGSMDSKTYLKDVAMGRMRARYQLPETRIGYAKAELIRALHALPDGAYFNIIGYADDAVSLAGRRIEMTESTRKRAIRWLLRQEAEGETNLWDGLRESFADYLENGGARKFEQLPDTVILLTDGQANRGRFRGTEALRDLVAMWNLPLDAVIHCVGFGADQQRALLRGLAEETGGFYVDLGQGLPALKPRRRRLPEPLRGRRFVGDVLEERVRLLREGGAEERRHAAAALGRKGFSAAAPALVEALGDVDEEVRREARHALVRMGAAAVSALIAGLQQEDETVALGAARALGALEAAARSALPELERLAREGPSERLREAAGDAVAAIRPS